MTPLVHESMMSDARTKLPALLDQVAGGVPTLISRRGKGDAVLASADTWRQISRPYAVHIDYLPDEGTGGWALWIPELRLHAEGATLDEARANLVAVVRDYTAHYLSQLPRRQLVQDRATELLYVLRLWLVKDDTELARLLFTSTVG